jgi:hypothetical protein
MFSKVIDYSLIISKKVAGFLLLSENQLMRTLRWKDLFQRRNGVVYSAVYAPFLMTIALGSLVGSPSAVHVILPVTPSTSIVTIAATSLSQRSETLMVGSFTPAFQGRP